MSTENRVCPKCKAEMKPGCLLERHREADPLIESSMKTRRDLETVLTEWIDDLPAIRKSLFGGEYMQIPRDAPRRYVLGFSCVSCGFVELYAVPKDTLMRYLASR